MFNDNLRLLRELSGISQTELANRLGIAVTTYRNYENTSREPSYDLLIKIAQCLGVSIDYLLGNTDSHKVCDLLSRKFYKLSYENMKEVSNFIDYIIHKQESKIK